MAYDTKQEIPEGFHDLGEHDTPGMFGGVAPEATDAKDKTTSVHYPELHFHGEHAEKLKKHLGEHGTATIHFKKISEGHRQETRDGQTKHHHSVGIQIHGIKSAKAENYGETRATMPKDEDAIEKGLEAASQETSNS